MIRTLLLATTSLVAATAATSAQAAVERFQYKDIYQANKEIDLRVNDNQYINNHSNITLSISAGLDRKLNVIVRQGEVITHQSTSSIINIDDMIINGSDRFYGKTVTFNAPNDGEYSVEIKTIATDNSVVNTENYIFTRDTTAPVASNLSLSAYAGYTNDMTPVDIWATGYYHDNFIISTAIEDTGSGVSKVDAVTFTTIGGKREYKRRTLGYDQAQKQARFDFDHDSGLWPTGDNADTIYGIEFHVFDNAGNVYKTPMQQMYYDTVGARGLELIGVRDPSSSNVMGGLTGYVPYKAGMTVNENPINIMYRIPNDEYADNHRGGYRPVGHSQTITNLDDGYVYAVFTRPFGFTDGNYVRFTDRRSWSVAGIGYSLKLNPNAPQTPQRNGRAEYLYSDRGWSSWSRWGVQNTELDLQVLGSRQRIVPQTYNVRWTHNGHSCIIPAGQESCEIRHPAVELNTGTTGYLHGGSTIESEDGTIYGSPGWADVSWNDLHYPIINSTIVSGTTLSANIEQPGAGSYFDNLRLSDAWLEDENQTRLSATRTNFSRSGIYYEADWDLNSLPEGRYQITVVGKERHGPTTRKPNVTEYISDRTAPSLSFSYAGETSMPQTLSDVRKIAVTLEDNLSEVYIDQLRLKSSDDSVDVVLGYSLTEGVEGESATNKTFTLEIPRLFPSLEADMEYTLTAIGVDEYKNKVTRTLGFRFIPDNLIQMETQTYLSVNRPLLTGSDNPIAKISSNVLQLDDGREATGMQAAEVTLKSTASYPLIINDVSIRPGETVRMNIDLGDAGGRLEIPVYPGESGEGSADLLFEIPQLTSKYD